MVKKRETGSGEEEAERVVYGTSMTDESDMTVKEESRNEGSTAESKNFGKLPD